MSNKISTKTKKMKRIISNGGISLYEYTPSITRPLYMRFEKMTFSRRIRLLLEFLHNGSYTVYYLAVDDVLVGYCVVAGGGRRLKTSVPLDIVLGPYYIDTKQRGKGYSKILIRMVLDYRKGTYQFAYDYIDKTNLPSIKASEACGFVKCGELSICGFFRNLELCESGGSHNIYKYIPNSDNLTV